MNQSQSPFRSFVLERIQEAGRRWGPPTVRFADRTISIQGEDIFVRKGLLYFLTSVSGFYLALPANVFGVVSFPDGTSQNMEGGVHEAPPGLYKIQYVDKHERLDYLPPISEMSTDGEKITLTVVLRYRVIDPIAALRIDRPVETLIEHVEADVAQYIRTHAHSDLADGADVQQDSKLLAFFVQRHNRRFPISKAFIVTGIEIKDFTGDDEYVSMRRRVGTEAMRNELEKRQVEYQQQIALMKGEFKAESEKALADHNATLQRKSAEHKAEIEQLEARHEKEKQAILNDVHLREIELNNKRMQLQVKREEFSQLMETLSRHFASGNPTNPAVLKTLTDLLMAYKEELDNESQPQPETHQNGQSTTKDDRRSSPAAGPRTSSDKVENLKNTLLSLLNPKK